MSFSDDYGLSAGFGMLFTMLVFLGGLLLFSGIAFSYWWNWRPIEEEKEKEKEESSCSS